MQETTDDDLMPKVQVFLYGNGTSSAPTAVELDRALVRDLFFNVSPAKVRSELHLSFLQLLNFSKQGVMKACLFRM